MGLYLQMCVLVRYMLKELFMTEFAYEDKVLLAHKLIYGIDAFVNNLLAAAFGGMMVIFNLVLGMNPLVVSLLGSLSRLMDALTDPLMGFISDNTRSR